MMKTVSSVMLLLLLPLAASFAQEQAPTVNHNTWATGNPMPTARFGAFAGAIGKYIYVIGGATNGQYQATNVNEIYNTKTNQWTTGAPDPTARELGASAVVNGILYLIGGSRGGNGPLSLVEAYDPQTDTWTTKSPMPTAKNGIPSVVDKNMIYVVGGYDPDTETWYDTVESYNTTTDTWTEVAPLPVASDWQAVGLLGTAIVAADGQTGPPPNGTVTGSADAYKPKKNTWTALTADPNPRLESCFAASKGHLYVSGGWNGGPLSVNEAYSSKTKSWTSLAAMPNATVDPASATAGGRLYCFGGFGASLDDVLNYVQIYQP